MSELQLQMKNTSFYTTPAMERFLLLDVENNYEQYILKNKLEITKENDNIAYLMGCVEAFTPGMEDTISFGAWLHDIKVMLGRLGNRVFKLGRTLVETVSKQYVVIMKMWDSHIQAHYHDIDDEHFDKITISCIPYKVLQQRVAVIKNIATMLHKLEAIVEAPIDDADDPNSYNTPIFVQLYKELTDIGFAMTNRTFTESKSQGYKSKEVKMSIGELDYSKSSLPELAELAKSISSLATKKWLNDTVAQFTKYNESLVYKERKLMSNTAIDENDKEDEIKKVRIRISRLWWLSNFVHMLHTLTSDQMTYILRIFRAADDSIPIATNPEDDGPGSKFF